jgi:hypothetical protein
MCSIRCRTHYFCVIIIQHAAEYGTRYESLASENYGNYCWILVDYSSGELAARLTLVHRPRIITIIIIIIIFKVLKSKMKSDIRALNGQ